MLSQIFGGMKDEGHSGSVRGRDQTDKITISGLAVIISTSPGLASVLGFIVVVTTTPHHTTPHHTTTYAPLSDYQVLDFLHSTRSLELPVLAVHESLCTVSGV